MNAIVRPAVRRLFHAIVRPAVRPLFVAVCLAWLGLVVAGCDLRQYAIKSAVAEQVNYIPDTKHLSGWELEKLADRVYTFRWTWDRSLVLLTDEGVVMTDPFNREAATILKGELEKVAPGQPVHTMFYTHYHLDHVLGGSALAPRNVVAHARCPDYWADLADDKQTRDILAPTRLIEGDQTFHIGGVEINLLYLGRTHTDTLYAYYLPKEKLLYTADFGLVRTVFPIGGPDMYTPGILKQMERLSRLDFDTWVPSHFGHGKKADFLEAMGFARTVRRLSLEALEKFGLPTTGDDLVRGYLYMYEPLKAQYGSYHGFEEESLFLISRAFSGAFLGY